MNIIYKEHIICNTQTKYQVVIRTQRHDTKKISYIDI